MFSLYFYEECEMYSLAIPASSYTNTPNHMDVSLDVVIKTHLYHIFLQLIVIQSDEAVLSHFLHQMFEWNQFYPHYFFSIQYSVQFLINYYPLFFDHVQL
jgi:hypothetical protein